ncbi:MAG: encapsulin, partial [Waterburya sp.]
AEPIEVLRLTNPPTSAIWGENVFSAVADGRSILTSKAQAQNYALFLPTKVYADTFIPPSTASLVTTAERISPLVEGGFYGTGTLPENKGLLVALAGDPTGIYVGREATTEFVHKEGSKYFFRVVERVQFVARDPRAFVLLKFQIRSKKV